MADRPGSEPISTRQQAIARRAQQGPETSFTSLHHRIDRDWLREAHRRTRKDGATGVDGQTAAAYGENLDFTVRSLKGNAVLRWEYRPGSALFLVWTQDRSTYDTVDAFSLSLDPLLNAHPENVFLAKVSYYFAP